MALFRKLLAFAGLAFFAAAATAQAPDTPPRPEFVLTNADSRNGIDLNGDWHYSIDPYRDGSAGFHGGQAGQGHRRYDVTDVDAYTREHPTALYEYDMRRSPTVMLPGSWLAAEPELRHYNGLVWYDRAFTLDALPSGRAFVRIGAANYHTRVYINGKLAGEHKGGFTPFAFEVTDLLVEGENRISLGVDSQRDSASVPPPVTDWETYGGVTRDIRLITVPETFIDDAWVRLDDAATIAVTVTLNGPDAADQGVMIKLPAFRIAVPGRTDENGVWTFRFPVPGTLKRWSPDSPQLYDVIITTDDDRLNERIGFRTIEIDGEDILLNGEPIYLRGISVHEEEMGENPDRAMTEDEARALLSEIKDGLGGNFVRLAHYPHDERMVRLADEMGLLVWSEIPVYWLIDWDNAETLATARAMQAENIYRDRNRASVILWSVGNETPVSDERNVFMRRLIADVRAIDDTRPVTAALLTEMTIEDGVAISRIDDPLSGDLDVLAVNTYHGWYGPTPVADVSEMRWASDFNKPLIFSEFGAGALAGFSDPELKRKFSEDYQAEYYRETLEMAAEVPFLRGTSPWILKDFRSPRRQHPIYQEGWNRKGLISETGVRKPAFQVLADFYAQWGRE